MPQRNKIWHFLLNLICNILLKIYTKTFLYKEQEMCETMKFGERGIVRSSINKFQVNVNSAWFFQIYAR